MKKSRFFYLHPDANTGKIASLDALQAAYTEYLGVCVRAMLEERRFSMRWSEMQILFPKCETLTSQIVKNVRRHAINVISSWAASRYTTKLRSLIKTKFQAGEIDEDTRSALCILGKRLIDKPSGKVTQEALNFYWTWLLDEKVVGRTPTVSDRCGMWVSELTAVLATSEETQLTTWWLGLSSLGGTKGKPRIQLPLSANPYVTLVDQVSKGILARKTKAGRWRFEVVEKKEWAAPEPIEDAPRIGVDVGLNVMAATSDGRLFGTKLKPTFNRDHRTLNTIRANRQRQGFMENSPRLDRLESKLTGLVKTMAGTVAHQLVQAYPQHTFVIEDLDLRGCRGQKRFAYRALHHAMASQMALIVVNPAYTSQMCPSCHHVHRGNRHGTSFVCRHCGRKSHADVVGAINLLGRSEDQQIGCADHPSAVRSILEARHKTWVTRSRLPRVSGRCRDAPIPLGRRLTVRGSSLGDARTASNQVVTKALRKQGEAAS